MHIATTKLVGTISTTCHCCSLSLLPVGMCLLCQCFVQAQCIFNKWHDTKTVHMIKNVSAENLSHCGIGTLKTCHIVG